MRIAFLILLFIVGTCFGSFLCCQARRLRLKETKKKSLGSRSVCLSCGYKLRWYDNIPILSWVFLRGKCRKCHKKIGLTEILSELGVGLAFFSIGTTIDFTANYSLFSILSIIFLFLLVLTLSFLAIYDGTYGELPSLFLIISLILAVLTVVFNEWGINPGFDNLPERIFPILSSVAILGGLYLVLYLISKGKWVGDGDWILGVIIGIVLGEPWLALITLFLANILACLIMLPYVKKSRNKKIYFGPFLIIAFIITLTFANFFQSMIK
ncbi:prepilin peptidase [Candidatus Saccharibacteria bacterium]|nr:prepilin peptidase [Candidatus Saccharibacteria bacterium]